MARLGNKIAQSFFTSENLRQDLLQRQTACLSFPVSEEGCPAEVDNYHSLCPLEPIDKTPPDQVKIDSYSLDNEIDKFVDLA